MNDDELACALRAAAYLAKTMTGPDRRFEIDPDLLLEAAERLEAGAAQEGGLAALRAQLADQQNDPLTLEELRGMDGEPVWIARLDDGKGWWAIARFTSHRMTTDYGGYFELDDYGKTWLAYRRPLEGEV